MDQQTSEDDLRRRLRLLQERNDYLQYQNALLQEAIETICAAFLSGSKDLDSAIQTALSLQQRASQGPGQIKPPPRRGNLEID